MIDNMHNFKNYIIFFFVFILLSLAVFYPSLNNEFMFDDYIFLYGNDNLLPTNIQQLVTETRNQHFIPLYYLINIATFHLFSGNPFPHHVFNLLLFNIHMLLIYMLIIKLTGNKKLGLLTCLLFCLHPVNLEIITFITESYLPLLGILITLSLLFLLKYIENHRVNRQYLPISLICYGLSLLCFETALLMPLYLVLVLLCFKKIKWSGIFKLVLPYFFISITYIMIYLLISLPSSNLVAKLNILHMSALSYWASLTKLIFWYVSNLFFPRNLVFMFNMEPVRENAYIWAMGSLFALILTILLIVKYRNEKFKIFSALWFLLGFLPLSVGIFSHAYMNLVIEPHWLYLSSLGFFMLCADLLLSMQKRISSNLWGILIIAICLYLFSFTKYYQDIWKSQESYCKYWLKISPQNSIPAMALSTINIQKKNYPLALQYLTQLLTTLQYNHNFLYNRIGYIYLDLKMPAQAKEYFQKSIEYSSQFPHPYNNLGIIYFQEGNNQKAEELFQKSLAVNSQFSLAKINLVRLYLKDGRILESLDLLEDLIKNHSHPQAYSLLGKILVHQNKQQMAVSVWKEGLEYYPSNKNLKAFILKYQSE